ncbi:unnamed protein product [Rhizophagus irregularis]|uniref:BTB domain-containing protein n=1 Tax=Rhizophagus irregularis TaxID=588596 RepID=A0A916E3H2_9GLOM|nr:unnamed protein product [Rhizophagus irregularis]
MEIHIGNYLDSNNYTNWSTSGLLQYLVEKENYTTEDATNIHNAFRCHLEKKSADHNMFKYARNKAERLARTRARSTSPKSRISMGQRQQDQRIQPQCQFIQTLIHDYSTLYEQKQRCDLKIRVADTQVFEVHSMILYARSSFFQEVLSTNKVEYEISIPDVSPQCFKTLLK